MISHKNKIIFLTVFSVIICFLTYHFCYFIAEKYFFDKFFYEKSIAYGYLIKDEIPDFTKYGKRTQDILALKELNQHQKILETIDKNSYKIVVIGDSHVWGQGILNEQRFAKILEDKLNKIRPTKIYSFGECGDNTLDFYHTYKNVSKFIEADLYIIVPVTNDAILGSNNKSDPVITSCQSIYPNTKPIYDQDISSYEELVDQTWINPINQCVLDTSLKLLPSDKSIYFFGEDYQKDWYRAVIYKNFLIKNNKYILSSSIGKNMSKYKKYWIDNKFLNSFRVSKLEGHPNALANKMYTDILYTEITTNPRWNFIK